MNQGTLLLSAYDLTFSCFMRKSLKLLQGGVSVTTQELKNNYRFQK